MFIQRYFFIDGTSFIFDLNKLGIYKDRENKREKELEAESG